MLAIDVETTGIDLYHGCLPFSLQACRDDGTWFYVEWPVDPFTRTPRINSADLSWYTRLLCEEEIVGHNIKFDLTNIFNILEYSCASYSLEWQWEAIDDTLLASHVLRNLWPHGLKELRDIFLFVDTHHQDRLREAVQKARRICRTKKFQATHGIWRIAQPGDPHWPAIKGNLSEKSEDSDSWWYCDTWLPKSIATLAPEFLPRINSANSSRVILHPWHHVLQDYALEDVETTVVLWPLLRDALHSEGLWEKYQERRDLLACLYEVERYGISLRPSVLTREASRYTELAGKNTTTALSLAARFSHNKQINLNSGPQLQKLLYQDFGFPVLKRTETGQPSTDAETLSRLSDYDAPSSSQRTSGAGNPEKLKAAKQFLRHLLLSRRATKSSEALQSYKDWSHVTTTAAEHYRTSENPGRHLQPSNGRGLPHGNGGILEERRGGTNLTRVPRSGDATQPHRQHAPLHQGPQGLLRLRLHPSINETGTRFTRQSGSNPNLQNVSTGKEEVGEDGEKALDYQLRVCFGPEPGRIWLDADYSNIELRIWAYSCGNKEFVRCFEEGTSVHMLIARALHPSLEAMSDDDAKETKLYKKTKNGNFAIIYGSSPHQADKTYGLHGAYDKMSRRFPEVRTFTEKLHQQVRERGYITTLTGYRLYIPVEEPHKAVSGFVQGTAGDVIGLAMTAINNYCQEHPEYDIHTILQVHDELLFDLPSSSPESRMAELLSLMEKQGERISIPLGVGAKLHREHWAAGETLKLEKV